MKINGIYITGVRSILALSSLCVLLFSPVAGLFPGFHINKIMEGASGIEKINIFFWFDNIYIPFGISIAVLVLVLLGIYPRLVSILHSVVSYSIFYSMLIIEGGDQINSILTFLLIPVCLCDNRIFGWKNADITIKNLYLSYFVHVNLLVIKVQMALLYLNAGVAKLFQEEWRNGTAVYYWFNDNVFGAPHWQKFLFSFIFTNNLLVSIVNYGVILLELMLFVVLFLSQNDKYRLFIFAFIFHLLIFLTHGLPSFGLSMTAGLVLLLFDSGYSISQNFALMKIAIKNTFRYDHFSGKFQTK